MYRALFIVFVVLAGCGTSPKRSVDPLASFLDSELNIERAGSDVVVTVATLDSRLHFDWSGDGAVMLRYLNDLLGYRFAAEGQGAKIVVRVQGLMTVEDAFKSIGDQLGERGTVFVDEGRRETRVVFESSPNLLMAWWRRIRS